MMMKEKKEKHQYGKGKLRIDRGYFGLLVKQPAPCMINKIMFKC